MTPSVKEAMGRITVRLASLQSVPFAAFFAYWSERLFPLYRRFEIRFGWGRSELLEQAMRAVWRKLTSDDPPSEPTPPLFDVEDVAPHGDDFEAPFSTYAQDFVVCLDTSVRGLVEQRGLDAGCVEYAIEPVITAVTLELTGYTALEGHHAEKWDPVLVSDSRIIAVLEDCSKALAVLEQSELPAAARQLMTLATTSRLNPDEFFPE